MTAADTVDTVELRADVRAWLTSAPGIIDTLEAILRVVSYPATVEQNDVADLIADVVGAHPDISVDRWIPDWDAVAQLRSPLDGQDLYIPLADRGGSYPDILQHLTSTVYTLHRGAGPTLMLNGHVDVVPVENQAWSTAAFSPRIEDGRLIARGATDMKAGLIAAALTFRYLADRWEGPGTILFAVVGEEETGGNGTLSVLQRGHLPDAVVFTECTDLRVVHRHVGIQGFSIDVEGHPGGMLRRSWGASAAPTTARVALALEELEARRTELGQRAGGYDDDDLPGYINFTMTSGDWIATRAARGHIEGLMGVLPGETQQEAADELRRAIDRATAGDDLATSVTIWPGGHRGSELPADNPLVQAFAAAPAGPGSATRAGTMVCDAKIVQGGGWAPAIVLGPTGGNLHSADEWVDLASIGTLVELLVTGITRHQLAPLRNDGAAAEPSTETTP